MKLAALIANLTAAQKELDAAGFHLAAIYLEHAIDEIVAALEDNLKNPYDKDHKEPN